MSESILEKVIRTTEVGSGGGGLLTPEQSNTFIDYMFDATVLGNDCRKIRMRSEVQEVDRMAIGQRLIRAATEAVDTGENAGVSFSKVSITTTKIRLDWEISSESLEDNIEGADLEDHIARLMATQFGNDLEDLAINGDVTSSDKTLNIFDGWYKLALGGAHVVDGAGTSLNKAQFNSALKTMPRVYMQRRPDLKWYTGSNAIQDYLYSLTTVDVGGPWAGPRADSIENNGPVRTEGAPGFQVPYAPFGVNLREVPLFVETANGDYSGATGGHGHIELTFPQNRMWGIKRDIQVFREFKPKKDAIEYTSFVRAGVNWENLDAVVIVKNVKVS